MKLSDCKRGVWVRTLIPTMGDDCEGVERTYAPYSRAIIDAIDPWGVTIVIEHEIVNVFEEAELHLLELDLGEAYCGA